MWSSPAMGMEAQEQTVIEAAEFEALVREQVPLIGGYNLRVDAIGDGRIDVFMPYREDFVRPGGTITGPALFGLADVALYGAVLSRIGRVDLAVTTSMTINFLRRPAPVGVHAEGRILKLGRRLAYGEVLMRSEGEEEPVAHATGTYSIPPAAGSDRTG